MSKIKPTHQHFKGGFYHVICEARTEEDGTFVTVYQSCETGDIWVMPSEEFNHWLTVGDGGYLREVRRFKPLRG